MTVAGAVRAAVLLDEQVLELLGGPTAPRWYPDLAPLEETRPLIVCTHVPGSTVVQDHDGLDGLEGHTFQIDAWATGAAADVVAEQLGRAVMRAAVERCRAAVIEGVRLKGAQVLDTRQGPSDEDETEQTPARRWGFDVRLWCEVEG